MLTSVRSQIVVMTVAVTVVVVAATSWLVARSVESTVQDELVRSLSDDAEIYQALVEFGTASSSWDEVADTVLSLAETYDRRIALTERSGRPLVDSDALRGLENGPLREQPDALLDPFDPSIGVLGTSLLDSDWLARLPNTPERDQRALVDGHNASIRQCLDRAGVTASVDEDTGWIDVDPDDAAALDMLDRCWERAVRASMAPPVLLYLGSANSSALDVRRAAPETIAIIAGVLVLAAGAAHVLTARITRDLARLSLAARSVGQGDLTVRVGATNHSELGAVGMAFDTMAAELARTETARRRMVADIAHELRNPLVTISGSLEAIQDRIYEPSPETFAAITDEADHLRRLIDDLQDLAAADAGQLTVAKRCIDLATLTRGAVEAYEPVAAAAGVDLRATAPTEMMVDADADRIRQVVANLVTNAIKHTPRGGVIHLALEHDRTHARLKVSDTGTGIAPQDIDSVFERFWRADPSRARATGGSGLGLAITRELVLAHDGDIHVTSAVGRGTTVTVVLPRRDGEVGRLE